MFVRPRSRAAAACESKRRPQRHFPKQTLRLPRLAQKNGTMGTRETHGTNYLSQGINEVQRASRRLIVYRETFWRSLQKIICSMKGDVKRKYFPDDGDFSAVPPL